MTFIRIRNWERFQHYTNRRPPWIKLYNDLLEKPEFTSLTDVARSHLIGIFLLASRYDNELPNDPVWIARKISATDPIDLRVLHHFLILIPASGSASESASDALSHSLSDSVSQSEGKGGPGGKGNAAAELGGVELDGELVQPANLALERDVRRVLSYLNDIAGTAFAPGRATQYLVERLTEGWSPEQCEQAVEAAMDRIQDLGDMNPQRIFSTRWFSELQGQRARGVAGMTWIERADLPAMAEVEELGS